MQDNVNNTYGGNNQRLEPYMFYGEKNKPPLGGPEPDRVVRDLEYLQGMYPGQMKRLQEYVIRACDKLDYQNSPIYDEYPDRLMVNQVCDGLCRQLMADGIVMSEEIGGKKENHGNTGESMEMDEEQETDGKSEQYKGEGSGEDSNETAAQEVLIPAPNPGEYQGFGICEPENPGLSRDVLRQNPTEENHWVIQQVSFLERGMQDAPSARPPQGPPPWGPPGPGSMPGPGPVSRPTQGPPSWGPPGPVPRPPQPPRPPQGPPPWGSPGPAPRPPHPPQGPPPWGPPGPGPAPGPVPRPLQPPRPPQGSPPWRPPLGPGPVVPPPRPPQSPPESWLNDILKVLLLNEMHRRRCRSGICR